MNKALFLDRDGTVIEHVHYNMDPNDVHLVPDCAEALAKAQAAGYLLVVISNQSGIARGKGTHEDVQACNDRMAELLAEQGITLDLILYCPHGPDEDCPCRKPKPGMLLDAAQQLDIDLSQSIIIGDNITDLQAGQNAGCKMMLFVNARDVEVREGEDCFDSLVEAVEHALNQ